jgi:hypothetical protein
VAGPHSRLYGSAVVAASRTFLPVRPRRRFVSVREPVDAVAAIVNAERPDVLVGYGGWVDLSQRFELEHHGVEKFRAVASPVRS